MYVDDLDDFEIEVDEKPDDGTSRGFRRNADKLPQEVLRSFDVIMMTDIPPKPRSMERTLEVNYYPITCIPSQHSVYGTISYNFAGLGNQPNLVYTSPGETAPSGRTYTARELFVLTKRDAFKEFPFLGKCEGIPADAAGALIVANVSNTNAIEPFYTVFLFGGVADIASQAAIKQVERLMDPDRTAGAYPDQEPAVLCINDFLAAGRFLVANFDIHVDQIDHQGTKCLVGISPIRIPVAGSQPDHPIVKMVKEFITPKAENTILENSAPIQEGFADTTTPADLTEATDSIGTDVGSLFKNVFTNTKRTEDGGDVPMGSIRVPLKDDPNYTYQECTMVPVDDIDMKDTEYVYQISGNSSVVSKKTVTIQGNLLNYLIIYFIMFLATYFGVPFIYAFLMCTLLKRGYSYTGFSSMVDYLKRPQNFLFFGKVHGLAIIFNAFYFFMMLSSLLFGTLVVGVWMLIMWITGYIGILNNPIPDTCVYI